MSDGFASLDAHAYVDNSLNAADRAAFEAAMRRDAELRARVDAWEAQNEAIRLAFGAAPRPRAAPALGRPSNENAPPSPPRRAPPNRARCGRAPVHAAPAAPALAARRSASWLSSLPRSRSPAARATPAPR